MTPFLMESKCVRNESEAIASSSHCGAQARKKSSTSGKPARVTAKQATTPRMKAITWLLVRADMQEPMAR